jgi:hypothetical protein
MTSQSLPPIGLEIPCSSYAVNVPLKVDVLGVLTMAFKGGWRVRVEENITSGLGGVRLRALGNEWNAESEALGKVTMSQTDIDDTPLSLLEITDSWPVFRNTMFLDWEVTVEKPPAGDRPLVLSNTKTATLICDRLYNFPPQGAVFQLQQPVDLAPVGTPDKIVATLQQFPLTVTYNP